jgi:hypothetical protein
MAITDVGIKYFGIKRIGSNAGTIENLAVEVICLVSNINMSETELPGVLKYTLYKTDVLKVLYPTYT